jgi:hypothetical protein
MAALPQALRDADAGRWENAERAMWRIWERCGDPKVERPYRTGIEQVNSGSRSPIAPRWIEERRKNTI